MNIGPIYYPIWDSVDRVVIKFFTNILEKGFQKEAVSHSAISSLFGAQMTAWAFDSDETLVNWMSSCSSEFNNGIVPVSTLLWYYKIIRIYK